MDITSLLTSSLPREYSQKLAKATGLSEAQISQGMDLLSGLLVTQVDKNTRKKSGATDFFGALDQHTDTSGAFDLGDATKILGHIFGDNQKNIKNALGKEIGADTSQSDLLMKMGASLFMKQLGSQKAQGNLDLNSLLDTLGNSATKAKKNNTLIDDLLLATFDKDRDGDYKDDILSRIIAFFTGKKR